MMNKRGKLALAVVIVVVMIIIGLLLVPYIFSQITGQASGSGIVLLNVNPAVGVQGWINVTPPEGVFEPSSGISGTHESLFSIRFTGLTIGSSDELKCDVKDSSGSLFTITETGLNFNASNYSLNYTVTGSDSIVNNAEQGYVPWVLKNCSVVSSSVNVYNQSLNSRIYTHSPVYWDDSEITRAVTCAGTPGVYFNNSGKCEFSEDTLFALQMRNGNPVNETCFNRPGVACGDNYCNSIFFPTCDPISYFYGYSASTDDPNNYANFTASFAGYNTPVVYTRYTNSSGNFKLRINQALTSEAFSFTVYNLTNVSSSTNVYGPELGSGTLRTTDQGDGTWTVAYYNFNGFTGTLDFVLNISFTDSSINSNRTLEFVVAYGTSTNQGNPPSFRTTFSTSFGLSNNDESETTDVINYTGGACGDEINNDFDYLGSGGIWDYSYDCFDVDCNNTIGDDSQTNEFGSGKTGICYYQTELSNCTDEFDNDYDTILGSDYTDCHDADCFHVDSNCPNRELICNDSINNDWDYTLGETDSSGSEKIENNGTKYDSSHQADLTDCEDIDCDGEIGGSSGELCNWGYETNCSDGFDNDALQLSDCNLGAVSLTTTTPTPAIAEYDCTDYCGLNNNSAETGVLCDDKKDNDWDAVIITGYYNNQYSVNTTEGAGIDCRWGGYYGIGSDYNPDEECNMTFLSSGNRCELGREINCSDSFDNDFDNNASGMPTAGWNLDTSGYLGYFGLVYSFDSDYDDYDCQLQSLAPPNESLNASWCFDSIDNDLDMYYWTTTWYPNSSTGRDCYDRDCTGVTNPTNANETCLLYEYNASDSFFNTLLFPGQYCNDTFDNDGDGPVDCNDTDCFRQFAICTQGPCYNAESLVWNSCLDTIDNDYANGTDCDDPTCVGLLGNVSGALCQLNESSCNDGFDNDADGDVDCDDSECLDEIGDTVNNIDVYCRSNETNYCYDGFDNDGDGRVDCDDTDCNSECGLAGISGSNPLVLPIWSDQTSINSVSVAYILNYTRQIRKDEWYNITFEMTSSSTNAQWTLGTAGSKFNKSSFDASGAYLAGPNSSNFALTETVNGFILDSNSANMPGGYVVSFLIQSNASLASSTYELTYAEETNSEISLNNDVYYEILEDIGPVIQSVELIPNSTNLVYGESVYIRANVSDNEQLGVCDFDVFGVASFNPADSTSCRGSFIPTVEGMYSINVSPVDYYGNRGLNYTKSYDLNIIPLGKSVNTDKRFYKPSESMIFNSTFYMPSGDTFADCEIIAESESGGDVILGSFSATGGSCNLSLISLSGLSDGLWSVYAKVRESSEDNIVEGVTTSIFVCSQNTSGACMFTDFDNNGEADVCSNNVTECSDGNLEGETGLISSPCTCGVMIRDNGYCCSEVWQEDACELEEEEEERGGGGGGSFIPLKETAFNVDPKVFRIDSFRKELKRLKVNISNTGDNVVKISFDSSVDFIQLPDSFSLSPGRSAPIELLVYVPSEDGFYNATVTVMGDGIEKKINLFLSVESRALFDITTTILPESKEVRPGENVSAEIEVMNLGDVDRIVIINYYLKDGAEIIAQFNETMAIPVFVNVAFFKELKVPMDIAQGNYRFYSDLSYDNIVVSSSDSFVISFLDLLFILLILRVLSILAVTIYVIRYFVKKIKINIKK